MRAATIRQGVKLVEPQRVSGRLIRGLGSSFAANLTAAGVAFGSSLLLARVLGSEQFGVFTYVNSWLNIAVLVATLGLDAALVRFLPEYAAREDWSAMQGLLRWSRRTALLASLGVAIVLAAVGAGMILRSGSNLGLTACAAVGSVPLLALVAINQGALQGLHRVGISQAPRAILRPLLLTAGVAGLWALTNSEVSAAAAMILNAAALAGAVLIGARWLKLSIPDVANASAPRLAGRHWLQVALPMMLVSGMGVLLHETSVVITAVVGGTTIAGVYAVATRMSRMLAFGMTAGNSIANPMISELYTQKDMRRLQLVSSTASSISLSVALVLLFGLVACGSQLLAAFGEDFQAGQSVVLILACGQLFNAATGPVAGLLNMTGRHNQYARMTLTISTLNMIGNVPGVLLWGIPGAAAVTSTMIAVQNIWAWYAVRRWIGIDSTPLGFLKARRMTISAETIQAEWIDGQQRRAA